MKSLKILLVNEKGCFEPGIIALAKVLSAHHRVNIVAPLHGKDGVGHKLTAVYPLRAEQFYVLKKVKILGVNGTPCDCVALALDKLLKSKPDLIISGIDTMNNRGGLIFTSGVVSAATLGTIHGVRSISVSAAVDDPKSEKEFLTVARTFAKKLPELYKNIRADVTLNVNFPKKLNAKQIQCTHLTLQLVDNTYMHEVNPFGRQFYWMNTPPIADQTLSQLEMRGDIYWLKKNFVAVTPLKYDLTNYDFMEKLEKSGIAL